MKTYLIFHIVGFRKWVENPIQGQIMEDKVVLRLIDSSYKEALKRAKKLIKRDQWFLAEVIEFLLEKRFSEDKNG